MQTDAHDIVQQRDAKISSIWQDLQAAQSQRDKAVSEYESRLASLGEELSSSRARLAQTEHALRLAQEESSRRSAEYAASLEARAIEVTNLQKNYSESIESLKAQYNERVRDMQNDMQLEIAEIIDNKEVELQSAKTVFSSKHRQEIEKLSSDINALKESSLQTIEQAQARHLVDMKELKETYERRIEEVRSHAESSRLLEVTAVATRYESEMKSQREQLLAQRAQDMDNLRESLESEWDSRHAEQEALHAAHVSAIETARSSEIHSLKTASERELAAVTDSVTERLLREHRSEIQLLRAQHLKLLEDTEASHREALRRAASDAASEWEDKLRAVEERLKGECDQRIAARDADAAVAAEDLKAKYQRKMKTAASTLASQLDDIKKQQESIEATIEQRVLSELELRVYSARQEEQGLAREALAAQLEALRASLASDHAAGVEGLRRELEAQFAQRLATASAEWCAGSEAALQERLQVQAAALAAEQQQAAARKRTELEKGHAEKIQELQSSFDGRSRSMQQSLSDMTVAMAQLEQKHKSELEEWTKKLQNQFEGEKISAISGIEEALRRREAQWQQERAGLERGWEAQVGSLRAQLSDAVASLQEERGRAEALLLRHEEAVRELRASHAREVQELRAEHAVGVERAHREAQERISKLEADRFSSSESMRSELLEIQALHRQALADAEARFNVQLNSVVVSQRNEFEARERDIISRAEAAAAARITAAAEKEREKAASELSAVVSAKDTIIASIQARAADELNAALQSQLELLLSNHKSVQDELNAQLQAYRNELASERARREREVAEAREAHVLEAEHRRTADESVSRLKAAHEEDILSITERLNSQWKAEMDAAANVQQLRHTAELASIRGACADEMRSLREKCADELNASQDRLVRAEADLARGLAEAQSQLRDVVNEHKFELDKIRVEYEAKLSKAVDNLQHSNEANVETLRAAHSKELHLLMEARESDAASFREELVCKDSDYRMHVSNLERRLEEFGANESSQYITITNLERHHKEELERIRGVERAAVDSVRRSLELKITEIEMERDARLQLASIEHRQELEGLRAQHAVELQNTNAEWTKRCEITEHSLQAEISRINAKLEATRVEAEELASLRLAVADQERRATLAELKAAQEVAERTASFSSASESLESVWRQRLADEVNAAESKCKLDFEKQLQVAVNQLDHKVSELMSSHTLENDRLQSKISSLQTLLQTAERELFAAKEESVLAIREVQAKLEGSARESVESALLRLRESFDCEKRLLVDSHDKILRELRTQHEAEIFSVQSMSREKQMEAIERIKKDHDSKLEEMKQSLLAQFEVERTAVSGRVQELTAVIATLSASLESSASANARQRESFEQELASAGERIKDSSEAGARIISQLETELARTVDLLKAQTDQYETEIRRLQALHDEEIERIKSEARAESARHRQHESSESDSQQNRISELKLQVNELLRLMQCTYAESKLTGPRMEGDIVLYRDLNCYS